MNLKFLFLIVLVSTLVIPFMDIHIFTVTFAQTSDPSIKGNEPSFIPSLDSERNPKDAPTDATSSENNDTQSIPNLTEVEDDNMILETDAPTENIVTLSNSDTLDLNTSENETKPTVTDEVSSSTNATEIEIQSKEQEPVSGGKSITIEEIPSTSTPSSKLEHEEQNNVIEEKLDVKEICHDEIDNDQDGILDEEHDCILLETGTISSKENQVPELATLDDKNDDEQKDKDTNKKENDKNDKDIEIITSKEICNDEIDNDLDGWMDEKEYCTGE